MDFLPTLSFIFTFLFFMLMVKKIRNGFGKRNTVSQLPPRPGKPPIIGSIHHLLGSLPHYALRNLSNRHGPFMEFQLAQVPAIIVLSSKSTKEIMKINDLNFAQMPELFAVKILTYGCTDVGFAPYGKHWRELQKLCVLGLSLQQNWAITTRHNHGRCCSRGDSLELTHAPGLNSGLSDATTCKSSHFSREPLYLETTLSQNRYTPSRDPLLSSCALNRETSSLSLRFLLPHRRISADRRPSAGDPPRESGDPSEPLPPSIAPLQLADPRAERPAAAA